MENFDYQALVNEIINRNINRQKALLLSQILVKKGVDCSKASAN